MRENFTPHDFSLSTLVKPNAQQENKSVKRLPCPMTPTVNSAQLPCPLPLLPPPTFPPTTLSLKRAWPNCHKFSVLHLSCWSVRLSHLFSPGWETDLPSYSECSCRWAQRGPCQAPPSGAVTGSVPLTNTNMQVSKCRWTHSLGRSSTAV